MQLLVAEHLCHKLLILHQSFLVRNLAILAIDLHDIGGVGRDKLDQRLHLLVQIAAPFVSQ